MSAQGWIKLHRKMVEWEWYDDHNTCRLFIHILLKCHRKEKRYRGTAIPAGSLITGRKKLSVETGLSERQIRTALEKLKSTNDVTIKTTTEYSIISVVNWNDHQRTDQQDDQQTTSGMTNERPASDQRATTIQEGKEDKERKKIESVVVSRADENPKTLLEEVTEIAEIDVGKQQSWFHQASIISELEQKHGRETVLAAARRGRDSAAASGSVMGSPRYLIPICQTIEAERNRPAPSGTGSPPSGPSDETPEQTIARLKALGLLTEDDDETDQEEACHG